MTQLFEITPGTLVGRYEILERTRETGLARIFRARDPELNRSVAIKVSIWPEDPDLNTFQLNEARTAADLQHPLILTLFDIGRHHKQVYLVFEFLPGALDQELRNTSTPLSQARVIDLIANVADALDFVHRRGYLHRNVKPSVILLDAAGQPRLSEFGLAVRRDGMDSAEMAGTMFYMAPEQLRHSVGQLGPHTDVWGLGVTLYELLCGQLPFRSDSASALIEAVLNKRPTPPSQIATSIDKRLEEICMKCLLPEPKDRYATANLLAADLRELNRATESPRQKRVFVSHSAKDRVFVEQEIVYLLENSGIATWYSKVDIQTAVEWERSIQQGLESTEWFILVMSSSSISSEWVKDELHWAIENRPNRLIPVLIEDCEPRKFHIRVARLQHIDFRDNPEEARRRLVAAFGAHD